VKITKDDYRILIEFKKLYIIIRHGFHVSEFNNEYSISFNFPMRYYLKSIKFAFFSFETREYNIHDFQYAIYQSKYLKTNGIFSYDKDKRYVGVYIKNNPIKYNLLESLYATRKY
jgi:hypothetical protein